MTKRQREEYTGRKELQDAGWQLSKADRLNSGSETARHATIKMLAGHYLSHELGYRAGFELMMSNGIVDVVGYGNSQRLSPVVVEIETGLTDDMKAKKINQYYRDEPIEEIYFLNPTEAPGEIMEAYKWVSEQI
jgi:hypothetical protein